MREIKFRGISCGHGKGEYDKDVKFRNISCEDSECKYGKWVYGDLVHGDGYQRISYREYFEGYSIIRSPLVFKETVGQYIGIKDKNESEIWEGDIVKIKWWNGSEEITIVVFQEPSFCCKRLDGFKPDDYSHILIDSRFQNLFNFEVIGNIHQHKELLDARD